MTASDNFIAHKSFHFCKFGKRFKNRQFKEALSLYVFRKTFKVMHLSCQSFWKPSVIFFCKIRRLRGGANILTHIFLIIQKETTYIEQKLTILFYLIKKVKDNFRVLCKKENCHFYARKNVSRLNHHANKMKSKQK